MHPQRLLTRIPVVQSRSVRMLRSRSSSEDAIRREEFAIKALEEKYLQAQAKLKQEEKDARQSMKRYNDEIAGKNRYFWDKMLPAADRKQLASYGIHSVEQLCDAEEEAETHIFQRQMSLEQLSPKLRFSHKVFESIPRIIHDAAKRSESKCP